MAVALVDVPLQVHVIKQLDLIYLIRTGWYSIVNIWKRLHSKGPCLFDDLSPAILTIGVVPGRCIAPFNTRGVMRFAQRLHSRIP